MYCNILNTYSNLINKGNQATRLSIALSELYSVDHAIQRIKGIFGTPTFIIWNGRKELGRIIGYSGKEWFYERLDELFQK